MTRPTSFPLAKIRHGGAKVVTVGDDDEEDPIYLAAAYADEASNSL